MRAFWVLPISGLCFAIAVVASPRAEAAPPPIPKPETLQPSAAVPPPMARPTSARPPKRAARLAAPAVAKPLPRPEAGMLPADQVALYKSAFTAAESGAIDTARVLAAGAGAPIARTLVDWLWLTRSGGVLPFAEISAFLERHGDWPLRDLLRRRAEQSLAAEGDRLALDWFAAHPPRSGEGRLRYGEALLRLGREQEGIRWLRRAWIEGSFSAADETRFHSGHDHRFDQGDHIARLDRLLWSQDQAAARRMLPRVPAGWRALANARMALAEGRGGVDRLIAAVPDHLASHPGLAYERVRWRRQRGNEDGALEVLKSLGRDAGNPERWWLERHLQARRLLAEGKPREAYQIVARHGLESGRDFAEAEWLAGWLALRFLKDEKSALRHFIRLHEAVRTPVSRARGAYWAGRAAEALGEAAQAEGWYAEAAEHSTTFYGQLAAARLERGSMLPLIEDPEPSPAEAEAFDRRDLVQAARLLAGLGQKDRLRLFIMRLNDLAESPAEHVLVSDLAEEIGHIDLAVASAKRSAQNGVSITGRAYPVLEELPADLGPERPLILALSRQESEFNPDVVSSAGARGLMQLMPGTARMVARDIKVAYQPDRLTGDPRYNARLGSRYLDTLLDTFSGSYVLALAAYNAGDGRVRRWMRDWGDPRDPAVDPVDWIESLPYGETRNYVQRVIESVQVYRQRLAGDAHVPLGIERDLRGGQPRSCEC